eukprot:5823889-Prorocentrum_lima.AAC.1
MPDVTRCPECTSPVEESMLFRPQCGTQQGVDNEVAGAPSFGVQECTAQFPPKERRHAVKAVPIE